MEQALADEEFVRYLDDRVGAVLADGENRVVERYLADGGAADLVAEIAGLFVVAELEVAVGSRARIDSFDFHDFGAARKLVAVAVDEILKKGDGIGNNAV